ncbi:hypothetical protein CEXT_289091 [Caerostris extrusa]|uniref:Uncharacterized protein n=1 Tax=Caerostris extrusa TaxID=172846 RepID=A0AAV4QVT8_CAEEX|nr:hypothetical protein CEXT_289091 [Caerostris extrusa]
MLRVSPNRCSRWDQSRRRDRSNFRAAIHCPLYQGVGGRVDVPFNLRAVRSGRRPQLRVSSKSFRFAVIRSLGNN